MSFGIPVRNGLGVGLLASTSLSSLRIGGRPAMSLDFIGTNSLDSRVTFTRGTTATFVGDNGLMQTAAINAPRFDYSPATLVPKGLLIEEARANILLYSQAMDNAAWQKNWGGGVTVAANQAAGPDGAQNLARITSSGTGGAAYQFFTLSGATAHSISIFVRQGTATTSRIEIFNSILATISGVTFLWTAGVPSTSSTSGSPTNIAYENFGGGLYRVSFTFITHIAGDTYILFLPDSTAGLGSSLAGYVQLEVGAFATSYIPTTTTTLTRNADVAVMTGANFSSWYNQTQGTFVTVASQPVLVSTTAQILSANNGTVGESFQVAFNAGTSGSGEVQDGGIAVATLVNGVITVGSIAKMAFAVALNDAALSVNGAAVSTDNTVTMPTPDRFNIGTHAGGITPINGHIRQIAYYNTRLPNTTLQALSA